MYIRKLKKSWEKLSDTLLANSKSQDLVYNKATMMPYKKFMLSINSAVYRPFYLLENTIPLTIPRIRRCIELTI